MTLTHILRPYEVRLPGFRLGMDGDADRHAVPFDGNLPLRLQIAGQVILKLSNSYLGRPHTGRDLWPSVRNIVYCILRGQLLAGIRRPNE
jgi:hypothetical protein